jgi:hypothetical protein
MWQHMQTPSRIDLRLYRVAHRNSTLGDLYSLHDKRRIWPLRVKDAEQSAVAANQSHVSHLPAGLGIKVWRPG